MNEKEKQEVKNYLDEELSVLFSTVDIIRASKDLVFHAPGNEEKRGEAFINKLLNDLKGMICDEWQFCRKRNNPKYQDKVNLVGGIADLISGLTLGISPFLIATVFVKMGLEKYCNCNK